MAFGIYIHIPYCVQRCSYCDFATYEKSSILPPPEYIEILKKEIRVYGPLLKDRRVDTIYFGGGTPSLVEPSLLATVLNELHEVGFAFSSEAEITLEINPATMNESHLQQYIQSGFNRFSVGAQTFSDDLLKRVGRKHSATDTQNTLELLARYQLNYTFDLLFALPGQQMKDLACDLDWIRHFNPNHVSAYCLTVPDGHPLSRVRLPEAEQVEMFHLIAQKLEEQKLARYEISNFAREGFESRHNMIYWTDQEYWGVGLSAHSYLKDDAWGKRFWNPNNIQGYVQKIQALPIQGAHSIVDYRDPKDVELLQENQALTDFCHTFLRVKRGLSLSELAQKFSTARAAELGDVMIRLRDQGLVVAERDRWSLTDVGVLLSNKVFEACTFLGPE